MNAQLRDQFTQWCRDSVFTPDMIQATLILNRAVDAHLIQLYRSLGMADLLSEFSNAATVTAQLGFETSSDVVLEGLLLRLADRRGFVEVQESGGETLFRNKQTPEDASAELQKAHDEMHELGGEFITALEFLDFGAEQFVRSLKDEPDFMDQVLTGKIKDYSETWFRATNVDPLQDVHGIMGAKAVNDLFPGGTILEVGGGTGNGIRNILGCLRDNDNLGRLEKFIFTDISMQFIMGTRHKIRPEFPDVKTEWRHLDINGLFADQKIQPGTADLVYGVNAAHIAKHTVKFIEQCKQTLKPGGYVVFSERVRMKDREMAPREIVLNLSKYHRTAAIRDPEFRPAHAYLSTDNWLRAFELAGFSNVSIWPDMDAMAESFPDQYAAVIVAQV